MENFYIFKTIGQRILFMTFLGGYIKYFIDKDLVLSSVYFILAVICFVTLPIKKPKRNKDNSKLKRFSKDAIKARMLDSLRANED